MTLIRGGRLIDPKSGFDQITDVLLDGETVLSIGQNLAANCETVDAAGLTVSPGLVDVHVHFREPGYTHKEDVDSGAAAAARGGFTTVICMANTNPVIDNPTRLSANIARMESACIRVLQAASVTVGMKGRELTDMQSLKEAGAACFSDDGLPIGSAALAKSALERAKMLDMTVSFHEEDADLLVGPGVNEGEVSRKLGLPGASSAAEEVLVARDCMLAVNTGARVVIQHISSANSVALVRLAKQLGADVHAEATPHHFSLTQDAVLIHGALAKMNPPLRTETDRLAILEGLRDGTVDLIATDHAPHSAEEKARPFSEAPSGIIGLETALALGVTNLVRPGVLTLPQLLTKMTSNPAACYRLDEGALYEGGSADLVLFDENEPWTVGQFASKASNSPFSGQKLYGKVKRTICRGKTVYIDGLYHRKERCD